MQIAISDLIRGLRKPHRLELNKIWTARELMGVQSVACVIYSLPIRRFSILSVILNSRIFKICPRLRLLSPTSTLKVKSKESR